MLLGNGCANTTGVGAFITCRAKAWESRRREEGGGRRTGEEKCQVEDDFAVSVRADEIGKRTGGAWGKEEGGGIDYQVDLAVTER